LTGSQLTINPTANLAPNTDYYVEVANGAIKDIAGNNYAGITGNSTWNFKTLVPGPINGTAGADNLTGTANADVINGLAGNDTLNGLAGNDTLDGGLGNDQLQGGLGNDTYIVDSAGDIITELAAQGTDEVLSSVTYTLPVEVENLTLTGTAAINGTGNGLANTITGNAANNTLNGGAGNDSLIGSAGNDIYVVDSAGDVVTEAANAGTDTVQSSVTYTLPVNVENLTLTGTVAINGTGNGLANTITGNTANNTINGDAGQDTLTGSTGVDTFIFQFGQSSVAASDRITDFAIGSDKIDLLTQGGAAMNAPSSFSRAANSTATTLQDLVAQVFTDANGALAGNQALGTNSATLVVATNASIAGTYLVINDGIAGFQASNDLVVNLTGYTGTLPPLGTITVSSLFV